MVQWLFAVQHVRMNGIRSDFLLDVKQIVETFFFPLRAAFCDRLVGGRREASQALDTKPPEIVASPHEPS